MWLIWRKIKRLKDDVYLDHPVKPSIEGFSKNINVLTLSTQQGQEAPYGFKVGI